MARERMVTRTVMETTVDVMCLNIKTAEVSYKMYKLSGMFDSTESALKVVKKLYETDDVKCVAIDTMREDEVLYGMTELDFIKQANVLPPRGTKANEV